MAGLLTVLLAVEGEHALAQEGVDGALRVLVRLDVIHRHIQGDALVDRLQPEDQVQRPQSREQIVQILEQSVQKPVTVRSGQGRLGQ